MRKAGIHMGISYLSLDLKETGKRIKYLFCLNGYSVKAVQELLSLSCPQSIYRWMSGKALPSVDHLYVLSRAMHLHIEDFLVAENEWTKCRFIPYKATECTGRKRKLLAYYKCFTR